jgi:hypothetical protein
MWIFGLGLAFLFSGTNDLRRSTTTHQNDEDNLFEIIGTIACVVFTVWGFIHFEGWQPIISFIVGCAPVVIIKKNLFNNTSAFIILGIVICLFGIT